MNAKNGNIRIGDSDCDYIVFGSGREALIMLPGVGDGFKTAKGVAVPFAIMYRMFAKRFRVYVFSRRNGLPEGFTTADMAGDINYAMEKLGIGRAAFFGVSQGGMIAQQMAILYPDKVSRMVLAVTAARPNGIMREALDGWLEMADREDYKGIMADTAERSYTGSYLRRGRAVNKLIALVKPKDFSRFKVLCLSCLEHDACDDLGRIKCPTFIIGADQDKVVGARASIELNEKIAGSELYMYKGYSHGVYEQAKDFNKRVFDYLNR